ncbi:MAG: Asp-tRNA(Asn)/Glu-tRNA(Gln) amidotransferase subunit GatA [Patescibacteria group bacterium]|nr:Asp-tRNA(Asn)/Glu-tRNA(Gln) amidotransferase subunit GatA [Patescibacteria group bacterium]
MDLTSLTIKQAHQGLINKEFSALELAKAYLNEIERQDKEISAFLTVCEKSAFSQAQKVDEKIAKGASVDVLAGIPMAVKDIIVVKDVKATAGSKILENYIAPYDATCIKKLKEKGVVILGKTNMDEFAMGSSTERSAFFPTKNPHDLTRVPGGSSGGSAAAVAANMSGYALGTDTCGSIRQPAGFCGVVGFKPTYGAVSRYGLIAMASSLDHIGPFTKTVQDCRIVFNAIKGEDDLDSTSIELPENDFSDFKIKGMKIGIPKEYFSEGIDEGVEKIVKNAIKKYEDLGAKIEEISLPHCTDHALATYYIIMPCEVSANLARYDGIKYGHFTKEAKDLFDFYLKTRGEGFGDEVRRRIMLGTYALSAGYYEAYYLRAQKIRTLIKQDFERAFKKVDVLMAPVAPTPAFKLGEKMMDPLSMYLTDIYMAAVSLAGLPGISVPCGKVDNLPVGLQIIGKYFEDNKIIKIAEFLES